MTERTGLATISVMFSLILIAACSGGEDPGGDLGQDAPDVIAPDSDDTQVPPDADYLDSIPPEDGSADPGIDHGPPESCEALVALWDWRCLDDDACATWPGSGAGSQGSACLGVLVCDTPPCWDDLCNEKVPGICVPTPGTIPCNPEGGCPDGTGCAGASSAILGTCRPLPLDDACWTDEDCPDNLACAGESVCRGTAPCPGPDLPGRCEARPDFGQCLDHDDCPLSGHCSGSSLCNPGNASCTAVTGTCMLGKALECESDQDCSPPNRICFGAFAEVPGTCVPSPASAAGECWDDASCGTGEACHGVFLCPQGTLCRSPDTHAGLCVGYPPSGHGVELFFPDDPVVLANLRVVVVNRNAIPIYLNSCGTADLEQKRNENWALTGSLDAAGFCGQEDDHPYLVIPPGGSRLLSPTDPITLSNVTRIHLNYALGCAPGTSLENCRVPFQSVLSAEVEPL